MAHSPATLSDFQSGETRLIFARHRDGSPELFMLPDGEAHELRDFTIENLLCPVPGCPTPKFTTVRRRVRGRDGFRHFHRPGFAHEPESQFHVEAKAELARWARSVQPDATVTEELASNAARERVADVMVEHPGARRSALEIQYTAMTPDQWLMRHESYKAQGIHDIWFLGHTGAQLRAESRGDSRVELTPAQQLMAGQGSPLIWFNPVLLRVGTLDPGTLRADQRSEHPRISAEIRTHPLTEFSLHPVTGLVHPLLADVHQKVTDFVRDRGLEAERDRKAAQKRAEDAAAREAERQALIVRAERIDQAWSATTEARTLLHRFGGQWPAWLGADLGTVCGVPPRMWQAYLLEQVLDQAAEGQILNVAGAAARVAHEFQIKAEVAQHLVHKWFSVLAVHGIVRKRAVGTKRAPSFQFHMPVNPLVQPARSEPRERPGLSRERLRELRDRPQSGEPRALSGDTSHELSEERNGSHPAGKPRCSRCGYPLDPMWAAQGFHGMCATPRRRYR